MALGLTTSKRTKEIQADLEASRERRKHRFRILVCVNGTEESYEGIRYAAKIGENEDCDIVLLYVRPIDQGLRSGGLQVRVARENMLDWGLELPGIKFLKHGLNMLVEEEDLEENWTVLSAHTDTWGDPLGDNKVVYRHESGKRIILKLKTAPDPASGILDQYELGPYNMMIMGAPSRWRGEFKSFIDAGVVQKVAMMSPCSVMVARPNGTTNAKGHLICTDGTKHSLDSMRREAVFASYSGESVSLLTVAKTDANRPKAERVLEKATEMLQKIDIEVYETHIGVGDPTKEILKAGEGYSVIGVADSGKNWLTRFVVSSVAFNVMGAANTSVLNVR